MYVTLTEAERDRVDAVLEALFGDGACLDPMPHGVYTVLHSGVESPIRLTFIRKGMGLIPVLL